MALEKTQATFAFQRGACNTTGASRMNFLSRLLHSCTDSTLSSTISRLEKKVAKLIAELREVEADNTRLNLDLTASLTTNHELAMSHTDSIRLIESDLETEREKNKALLEKRKELEFTVAESKARLVLNDIEKKLMSDLLETLRQEVKTTIASLADSYGSHNRPERNSDGVTNTR